MPSPQKDHKCIILVHVILNFVFKTYVNTPCMYIACTLCMSSARDSTRISRNFGYVALASSYKYHGRPQGSAKGELEPRNLKKMTSYAAFLRNNLKCSLAPVAFTIHNVPFDSGHDPKLRLHHRGKSLKGGRRGRGRYKPNNTTHA